VRRGIYATEQFPKIYGLLMEWCEGPEKFTISVTGWGEANLYTTAGFGYLGGGQDAAPLQVAAQTLVAVGQQFHDIAKPVNQFPYPQPGKTHFYLLTYTDVRLLEFDDSQAGSLNDLQQRLFGAAGQAYATIQLILEDHRYEQAHGKKAAGVNPPPSPVVPPENRNPEDLGRKLRMKMLTTPPGELGIVPSSEFPRIYGVLIDLPSGPDFTVSIQGFMTGEASLYSTAKFQLIGGDGYASVRAAARRLVRGADQFFEASEPATSFPYPADDKVFYYLLTFAGVRLLQDDLSNVRSELGATAKLYELGQGLLTQLRLASSIR
jgi:hypothetical protein